ncbi:MAG: hypothetical protein V2G33_07615 [bacterium JZ-2024 1]
MCPLFFFLLLSLRFSPVEETLSDILHHLCKTEVTLYSPQKIFALPPDGRPDSLSGDKWKEALRPDISFFSILLVGMELRSVLESSLRNLSSGRKEYLVWSNVTVSQEETPKISVGKEPLMPHRVYQVCVEESLLDKKESPFPQLVNRVLKKKQKVALNVKKAVEEYYRGVLKISRPGARIYP